MISTSHPQTMTELEKFEAAFVALPPLPEEVRATVLLIWLEVMSGHVDLSKLRELCLESFAQPEGNYADAMTLDLVKQLIARCGSSRSSPAAFSARHQRCGYRTDFRFGAGIRSRRRPRDVRRKSRTFMAQPASAPPGRIAAFHSAGPRWRRRRSTTLTGETQWKARQVRAH